MSHSQADLLELAKKLRYNLTASQAQLTDLMTQIAALPIADNHTNHTCPTCGINRPTEESLKDHLELIHEERSR